MRQFFLILRRVEKSVPARLSNSAKSKRHGSDETLAPNTVFFAVLKRRQVKMPPKEVRKIRLRSKAWTLGNLRHGMVGFHEQLATRIPDARGEFHPPASGREDRQKCRSSTRRETPACGGHFVHPHHAADILPEKFKALTNSGSAHGQRVGGLPRDDACGGIKVGSQRRCGRALNVQQFRRLLADAFAGN